MSGVPSKQFIAFLANIINGDMCMEEFFRTSRSRIGQVLEDEYEIIETDTVPEIPDLPFRNRAGLIETSVLFVDLRGSSDLTEGHRRSTVAKIHKGFLNEMVQAARYWTGKIRGFAGDRLMVLFDADERPANNAVDTAITMQTIVKYILSPRLKKRYEEEISCGIGIDFGKMLVAKVGMKRDPNHNDLVWTGGPANIASKLADEASGGEIRVTDRIYLRFRDDLRKPGWWTKRTQRIAEKKEIVYCNYGLYKTPVENI